MLKYGRHQHIQYETHPILHNTQELDQVRYGMTSLERTFSDRRFFQVKISYKGTRNRWPLAMGHSTFRWTWRSHSKTTNTVIQIQVMDVGFKQLACNCRHVQCEIKLGTAASRSTHSCRRREEVLLEKDAQDKAIKEGEPRKESHMRIYRYVCVNVPEELILSALLDCALWTCGFYNGRRAATMHRASLPVPFSQQHSLMLCLCHILVILAAFQTFSSSTYLFRWSVIKFHLAESSEDH